MKTKILSSGSNVLIKPLRELGSNAWLGYVDSTGYNVPDGKYQEIEYKELVIYDKDDVLKIIYEDQVFDSLPHYKIHAKVIEKVPTPKKKKKSRFDVDLNEIDFANIKWSE